MDSYFYRGSRKYIHSTSLCNYLHRRHPGMSALDITIRKFIIGAPQCLSGFVVGAPASARIMVGQNEYRYSFVEGDGKILGSEAFSEDQMDEEFLEIDNQVLSLRSCPSEGFTFFDRSICGGKHLILKKYQPSTRLILAKLSITQAFSDSMTFFMLTESRLGERLYKISIESEAGKIGEAIYYGK